MNESKIDTFYFCVFGCELLHQFKRRSIQFMNKVRLIFKITKKLFSPREGDPDRDGFVVLSAECIITMITILDKSRHGRKNQTTRT